MRNNKIHTETENVDDIDYSNGQQIHQQDIKNIKIDFVIKFRLKYTWWEKFVDVIKNLNDLKKIQEIH